MDCLDGFESTLCLHSVLENGQKAHNGLDESSTLEKKMTNGHEMQSDTGVAKKRKCVWIKKVGISTRPEELQSVATMAFIVVSISVSKC